MLRQTIINSSRRYFARNFSSSAVRLAAYNFAMPAMSPTMTEGGIVEWKVKEGDSFSAGDVLLEVETDKAQIDVEAQDDGVLARIYAQAGEKGIPVGKSIAVIAEPEDNLSSLELPSPEEGGVQGGKQESAEQPKVESKEIKEQPKEVNKSSPSLSSSSSSSSANPGQTLLPSVQSLLHRNNISQSEALSKIPASGPNGRLLKGDVLAYLGTVSQESIYAVQAQINKLAKLDLSNIKLREPEPGYKAEQAPAATEKPRPTGPVAIEKAFSLEDLQLLKTTVGGAVSSPVTVERLVEKASKLALRDVSVLSRPQPSILNDPIFEDLISPPIGTKSFDVSLSYQKRRYGSSTSSSDIYSILASINKPVSKASRQTLTDVKVSVMPNARVPGSEQKAHVYLDRLGYYLSHANGDLVL